MLHFVDQPAAKNRQEIEDKGLFPSGVTQIRVGLMPRTGETGRGDWVVAGLMPDGKEVEVVFAGRRTDAAMYLRRELTALWRHSLAKAQKQRVDLPAPEQVILPVTVEGGWRMRFSRDEAGCETRHYQFIAARWTFLASDGQVEVAGQPVQCECTVTMSPIPPGPMARTLTRH